MALVLLVLGPPELDVIQWRRPDEILSPNVERHQVTWMSLSTDLTRCQELWFSDGTVVLKCHTTVFRVYSGILAAQSLVFRDMFAIGSGNNNGNAEMDGVPVVDLVGDDVQELTYFLRTLFDTWYDYFRLRHNRLIVPTAFMTPLSKIFVSLPLF